MSNVVRISLNTNRSTFCVIDQYAFTFGEQEHDVDLDSLDENQKRMFLYNLGRGVLTADSVEEVRGKLIQAPPTFQGAQTQTQQPVQQPVKKIEDLIKEKTAKLKKFLNGRVPTIKREVVAQNLGFDEIGKLLELEKQGKNRKSVIAFLDTIVQKHQEAVVKRTGEDVGGKIHDPNAVVSTQVTDVVESEVEEVEVPTPEEW